MWFTNYMDIYGIVRDVDPWKFHVIFMIIILCPCKILMNYMCQFLSSSLAIKLTRGHDTCNIYTYIYIYKTYPENYTYSLCFVVIRFVRGFVLPKYFTFTYLLHWGYKLSAFKLHYSGVIMSAMASQIPGVSIVWPTVYSGADQSKHQSFASLAFAGRIHRWPVDSPHKGPVMRKMFPFDDVIMGFLGLRQSDRLPQSQWRVPKSMNP